MSFGWAALCLCTGAGCSFLYRMNEYAIDYFPLYNVCLYSQGAVIGSRLR